MNVLARHIKSLLLTHRQVVLPQFGTFYTEREEAHFAGDDVFVPETCRLCFTPLSCVGDDLLLESFEHEYRLTREEAQRRLDAEIADCGKTLACNGSLDFDTLGTFVFTGGRIDFHPCKAGLTVPAFYGLDSFAFPQLPRLASDSGNQEQTTDKHNYVIRLNRQLVHYAASIAVAVIIFFSFNTPLGDGERHESFIGEMTGMYIPHINRPKTGGVSAWDEIERTRRAEHTSSDIVLPSVDDESEDLQQETSEASEQEPTPSEAKQDETGRWTIVLASDVPQKNANQYVDILTHEGYENVRSHSRGRMLRVIYGSFESHDEANEAAQAMRAKDKRFATVWLLQL